MDPRSHTDTVLSTRALETPAADPPQALDRGAAQTAPPSHRPFLAGGGDEPRGYRRTGRAPARTTGVSSVRPDVRAEEAKKSSDFWLDTAQKGIGALGDSVKRIATQQGREEARFSKALGDALLEVAKKEAAAVAQTIPYAKVIVKAIRLSEVFADAAGRAIVQAGARLNYDRAVAEITSAREVTEETVRALQFVRGWQRNSAAQLEGILRAGLLAVVEEVIKDLFGQVEDTLSKSLKSVVDQVAKHVFRQNEILAILNDAITEGGNRIPATRARMERALFHTLADTWVKLSVSPDLQGKLAPLLAGLGGKDPVHVSLLAGLLEVISRGTYEEYARHVRLREGRDMLRALLVQTARDLLEQAREGGVEVAFGDAVTVAPDRVTAPESLLKELDGNLLPPDHLRLYLQRVDEFEAATRRLSVIHLETRRRFQEEIRAAERKQAANWEVYVDIERIFKRRAAELRRLREKAITELRGFVRLVERELGSRYEGLPTALYLTGPNEKLFWDEHFPADLAF